MSQLLLVHSDEQLICKVSEVIIPSEAIEKHLNKVSYLSCISH